MSPASPPPSEKVAIDLGDRAYDILIGDGLLASPSSFEDLPRASRAVIVSQAPVASRYAGRVREALAAHYRDVLMVELPDGEAHKDWVSLDLIFDALLAAGCDRRTVIFALGGGVVGDVAGFAAASYMRGVPYVQLPTTLLAQVDSSVGGKTAINHARGKNMIGAFWQPQRVIADLSTLDTLPPREISAGLAEIIKYGPIADVEFLAWLEAHMEALRALDRRALAHAVKRSCEIKARVVAQDEREGGLRAILNFGHTFAHAIETGLGHGAWLHGEAVGCGMVMALDLSVRGGLIDPAWARRVVALIERAGLPLVGPKLGAERYLELMRLDKKAEDGDIRFVVIEAPGRAALRPMPERWVTDVIEAHTA